MRWSGVTFLVSPGRVVPDGVPAAGEADRGPGVRLALPRLQVGRLVPLQLSRRPLVQARQLQHGTAGGNISPTLVSKWRLAIVQHLTNQTRSGD